MNIVIKCLSVLFCDWLYAELSVGMQTEGVDIRSVGNTQVGDQCEDSSLQSLVHLYLLLILLQYMISVLYYHSQVLHETALVETFNLKAAIEYQLKNCKWWLSYKSHLFGIRWIGLAPKPHLYTTIVWRDI